MAFNIPVNLMNTAAPPSQQQVTETAGTTNTTTVQPAIANTDTQGAASDGGGANRQSAQQQSLMFQQRTTLRLAKTPDTAEAKSVIAALTTADAPEQRTEPTQSKTAPSTAPVQSELDRYAPPNPLPTAPILQLAASYAALTKRED